MESTGVEDLVLFGTVKVSAGSAGNQAGASRSVVELSADTVEDFCISIGSGTKDLGDNKEPLPIPNFGFGSRSDFTWSRVKSARTMQSQLIRFLGSVNKNQKTHDFCFIFLFSLEKRTATLSHP